MNSVSRGMAVACLTFLISSISPLRAITPERPSLKSLAMLPGINFTFGYAMDGQRGLIPIFEDRDFPAEIVKLQKRVKEHPNDVDSLWELSCCYWKIGARDEARSTAQKLVELLQKKLQSRGENGSLLADLGRTLSSLEKYDEAEAVLRKAISADPHNWRSWVGLGDLQRNKIFRVLSLEEGEDAGTMLQKLVAGQPPKPSAQKLDEAKKLMDEAARSYDKATELSPKDPAVYRHHADMAGSRGLLKTIFQYWKGEWTSPKPSIFMSNVKEALPDYRRIAELSPKNERLPIGLTYLEAYVAVMDSVIEKKSESKLDALPMDKREVIRKGIAKLENMAQDSDPKVSSGALEELATVQSLFADDQARAAASARRALELDPTRGQAWNVLMGGLIEKGKPEDMIAAAESRVKAKETVFNHVLAAKAYDYTSNNAKAKEHIQKALQMSPDNIDANIAAAALALRVGDAASLSMANNYLNKAFYSRGDGASQETAINRWLSLTFNRGILLALAGDEAEARKTFEALLSYDKDFEQAKQALSLLRSDVSGNN